MSCAQGRRPRAPRPPSRAWQYFRVKYVVIILGGASDLPCEVLGARTPLEAASLPNLTRLAARGRVGLACTTPQGAEPSPARSVLSILGYDGATLPGIAPLEALARGVDLRATDIACHLHLLSTPLDGPEAGRITDTAPRGLGPRESAALLASLLEHWRRTLGPSAAALQILPQHRAPHLLIDASGQSHDSLHTAPPAAIAGHAWKDHLPTGVGVETLRQCVESSIAYLSTHEINIARVEQSLPPANLAWISEAGTFPKLLPFTQRFKARGVIFAEDESVAGAGIAVGLDRLPLFCGLPDDPRGYTALAESIGDALHSTDLVVCHIDDCREAAHQANPQRKADILEAIDAALVGPVVAAMEDAFGDASRRDGAEGWRILIMPDCGSSSETCDDLPDLVPFVMAGAWVRSVVERAFSEAAAAESDLTIDPVQDLMEYFLRSGLASARVR